ncbi:TetR/AcrR family transcriptional regulator C-terminal domain-containing protein [Actinoplanes sp. URMC 104]|uniref:TetR/AcrR family transcriptional regulator C-terminal domain-containing protein n=1 Tax=Actinoplanes sp. URMC 104 TaxID=3423409 RepID=UPI003F19FF06
MRAEGLEKVTMRRLAAELDTGPASLYVYVRNTAELHGAMLDELVADLEQGAPAGKGWREQLIGELCAFTELLFAWPSLARSVLVLRPSGPHYLGLIDRVLGLLLAGGVQERQAAWGADILLQLATATAAEQGSRDESVDAAGEEQDLALAVAEAEQHSYPNVVRVRGELLSGSGEERLRWAFGTVIDGLRQAG